MFLVAAVLASATTMDCRMESGSCTGGYDPVLNLYDVTNSHVELATYSNYNNIICCDIDSGAGDVNWSIAGGEAGGDWFVDLYDQTNSHIAENNDTNYNYDIWLFPEYGTLDCAYINGQDCVSAGYQTCVIRYNQTTNSHASNCSDTNYPDRVCCSHSGQAPGAGAIPEFSTIGIVLALVVALLGIAFVIKKNK